MIRSASLAHPRRPSEEPRKLGPLASGAGPTVLMVRSASLAHPRRPSEEPRKLGPLASGAGPTVLMVRSASLAHADTSRVTVQVSITGLASSVPAICSRYLVRDGVVDLEVEVLALPDGAHAGVPGPASAARMALPCGSRISGLMTTSTATRATAVLPADLGAVRVWPAPRLTRLVPRQAPTRGPLPVARFGTAPARPTAASLSRPSGDHAALISRTSRSVDLPMPEMRQTPTWKSARRLALIENPFPTPFCPVRWVFDASMFVKPLLLILFGLVDGGRVPVARSSAVDGAPGRGRPPTASAAWWPGFGGPPVSRRVGRLRRNGHG